MVAGLKYFAFYDQLGFQAGRSTWARDLERFRGADKDSVVAYLRAGTPLVVVPGTVGDPIGGSGILVPGGGSVLTDGVWAWPLIAAELVDMYDIAVPESFRDRMTTVDFVPPRLSEEEVRQVFSAAGGSLKVSADADSSGFEVEPALMILDLRVRQQGAVLCTARAVGGPVDRGQDLWTGAGVRRWRVAGITRRAEELSHLPDGETARVTLEGADPEDVTVGALLRAVPRRQ
ncbi:hypothetical protein [Micromonospora sp. HK10]|uniref:hypothetical protein n=1 Tax=Micromonospora sp. HK10 TaxID=1538294 RepID=UPI0006289EF1|nr:hypothetical protein [Micromonospora sp. HK10]KKK03536.1 hypothetical protein LQ51_19585 [Micromonospora sp. HK10]